ncbi:hypothetical protein MNBD_GAMMA11-2452 [hydrothermal vent metagenome]|uniref:SpaA-like prealbumin fold domain-containing protein n=1 Tax=hydrothermal vent metagenome TaxID=652676 RepID=A0A3B0XNS8_9ZZZZ
MTINKHIKLATLIFFLCLPVVINATNLRGKIEGNNQHYTTPYPLAGAKVVLYFKKAEKWEATEKYTTGPDGMYYFKNIPAGQYSIQVNGRQNYPVSVSGKPEQDLAPIVIAY